MLENSNAQKEAQIKNFANDHNPESSVDIAKVADP